MNFTKWVAKDQQEFINKRKNPKRLQREVKKETKSKGIGTKVQIAIKQQYEENKIERKQRSKEQKEKDEERIFEIKKKKRLEKHKGH